MSVRPPDGPLTWNVAGLMADEAGMDRHYEVHDAWIDLPDERRLAEPISGVVRLARTNRGILVDARLTTVLAGECSRCLKPITTPLILEILDEYLPSLDLTSGAPLPTDDEPDALRLTDHHELSLETPVVDAIILAEPIAPVCRPDCPGLCVVCGEPLEAGTHDHPDDDVDPRLEALRAFHVDA